MTTKRYREPLTPKVCPECRETFDIYRYDTQFCSPKCRKRRERWLKDADKQLAEAMAILDKLKKYHDTEKDDTAFQALKKIQGRCASILDYWD